MITAMQTNTDPVCDKWDRIRNILCDNGIGETHVLESEQRYGRECTWLELVWAMEWAEEECEERQLKLSEKEMDELIGEMLDLIFEMAPREGENN